MSVTESKNERPYLSYPYHALEQIAGENWEDENVLEKLLNELRFRKTAFALYLREQIEARLKELESFAWVSTKAENGSGNLDTSGWKKDNLLSLLGYKSGNYGLDDETRKTILDIAYTKPISKKISPFVEDIEEWGMPNRATRLKKMAHSIASVVRSEKRHKYDYRLSISEREADLAYLKERYYDGVYDFPYPRT